MARACLLLLVLGLLAIGLGLLLVSFLPFSALQAQVSRFMPSAFLHAFTEARFQSIVPRCRLGGLALLAAGCLLHLGRRPLRQALVATLEPFPSLVAELLAACSAAIRAETPLHLGALAAVTLLAAVFRLAFLFQPMRFDEAATYIESAAVPLYVGLSKYEWPNNHLLNTFLVHLTTSLLGDQPWVIRLPAFVAGVLLVPLSYVTFRVLYDKQVALVSAALVAPAFALIEYSTNGRGYTLLALIWLLLLVLAAHLVSRPNRAGFLVLGILSALGFYTIPIMLYPFGIALVWLLLSTMTSTARPSWSALLGNLSIWLITTAVLTLVLYTPVLIVSGVASLTSNQFVAPVPWSALPNAITTLAGQVWRQWNRDVPVPIQALLLTGFAVATVGHQRVSRFRVPVVLAAVIWLVPVVLLQRAVRYERVWLFLLPVYLGMGAAGTIALARWVGGYLGWPVRRYAKALPPAAAVVLALWLGGIGLASQAVYYSEETGTLQDAEAITLFLQTYLRPGDQVLTQLPSSEPLLYYFLRHGVPRSYLVDHLNDGDGRLIVVVNEANHQTLPGVLSGFGWTGPSEGRVVQRYPSATVYEIPGAQRGPAG